MKRTFSIISVLLFSLALNSHDASANKGTNIDWVSGKIYAYGSASVEISDTGQIKDPMTGEASSLNRSRINSYRIARETALQNLMSAVRGLRVDSDNYMSDLIEQQEFSQSKIYEILNSRSRAKEYPENFTSSSCRMEIKIGDLMPVLPYKYPSHRFPERMDLSISTKYTGLIIDARGVGVEPMIFPSILNEDGLEIYGRYFINIHTAGKNGIVSYAYNENDAMKHKKAGDRPYFAVAVKGLNGSPVISDRDIRRIYSSEETLGELKKCRVIFIIDRKWQ